jgi:hypothetical protein
VCPDIVAAIGVILGYRGLPPREFDRAIAVGKPIQLVRRRSERSTVFPKSPGETSTVGAKKPSAASAHMTASLDCPEPRVQAKEMAFFMRARTALA